MEQISDLDEEEQKLMQYEQQVERDLYGQL